MKENHTTRREFIKAATTAVASLMTSSSIIYANSGIGSDTLGDILPLRNLGNTGAKVTILGLGGYHIGCFMSELEAEQTIRIALEEGVRFFDSAQAYCDGETERRLGKFLPQKDRDKFFLMAKTKAFDAKTAKAHLEMSLKNLKTDYLDLWQVHNVFSIDNLNTRIENGILDVMTEAKEKGLVKHIGFTGHANPQVHLHMLSKTEIFETCQLPLNVVDHNYLSFTTNVLPILVKREMGVIVIKSLGGGSFFSQPELLPDWSERDPVIPAHISIKQAMNYVWSLPVSTIVTGADNREMLREKIKMAQTYKPLTAAEQELLINKVADMAGIAEMTYKTRLI